MLKRLVSVALAAVLALAVVGGSCGITAGLVVTLPFYSKWIRKIKTSVEIEDNGDMAQIEISD